MVLARFLGAARSQELIRTALQCSRAIHMVLNNDGRKQTAVY